MKTYLRFSLLLLFVITTGHVISQSDWNTAGNPVTGSEFFGGDNTATMPILFSHKNNHANSYFIWQTTNGSTTEKMRLTRDGWLGLGTTTPGIKFHVADGGILSTGTSGTNPNLGAGTYLMWIPDQAAFRAGIAESMEWDGANVGDNSAAFGINNEASGVSSFATGDDNLASGDNSACFGTSNTVSGGDCFAAGEGNIASGANASCFGLNNVASGNDSFAAGLECQATEEGAIALGDLCEAKGHDAFAAGELCIAYGPRSIALGQTCSTGASASSALSLGEDNIANGAESFAIGRLNDTSAQGSGAIGCDNDVAGLDAIAIGRLCNIPSGADFNIVLGNGIDAANRLSNTTDRSLIVGFNSTTPTLFVSGGNGTAGSYGEVGIGTITPHNLLHINESSTGTSRAQWTNNSTGSGITDGLSIGIAGSTVNGVIDIEEAGDLIFETNISGVEEKMRILQTGEVGIGISSPTSILHTVAAGSKTASYSGNKFTTTATSSTATIDKVSVEITSTGTWNGTNSKNIGLYISSVTGGTNNYDAIFNGGGNVGIGVISPTALLHTIASGAKTTNYSGNLLTNTATSSTSSVNKSGVEITSTGTWNGTSSKNIGLYISSVTGGTLNYDAIFNGGGNVGIGTDAPHAKLSVHKSVPSSTSAETCESIDFVGGSDVNYGIFGDVTGQDDSDEVYGIRMEANTAETNAGRVVGGYFEARGTVDVGTEYTVGAVGWAENEGNAHLTVGVYGYANNPDCTTSNRVIGVYGEAHAANPPCGQAYGGLFYGTVTTTGTPITISDESLKTNVNDIENALNTLSELNPKSYYFTAQAQAELSTPSELQYGFLAQEIEEVMPELVGEVPAPISLAENEMESIDQSYKGVKYGELIPILVAAVQELDARNTQLQSQLEECCEFLRSSHESINDLPLPNSPSEQMFSQSVTLSNEQSIVLNQNTPNPFAEKTTITFRIPVECNAAQILFYDGNGNMIHNIDIFEKGNGQLTVFAENLSSGMYSYALVVDGILIATKHMVKH